jgi:tetratricopeptide (TPR) repeat protein
MRFVWRYRSIRLAAGAILFLCLCPATPAHPSQDLPALPTSTIENFGPAIREQVRTAEEAAAAFRRRLEINSFHAEAHHNYGTLVEREGRLSEASKHYRAAIANKPNLRGAHFNLGRILIHQGELAEAIKHFLNTLTPEDEDTPRFTYALAAAYARIGDREHAIQHAREARRSASKLNC